MKRLTAIVLCLVLVLSLAACGGTPDFKTGVQGTWAIYHWYEEAEGGEDVFLDDTNFITISIDEDSFTATAADDSLKDVGGTYTWTKADEAEVVMNDGRTVLVESDLRSDKKRKGRMNFTLMHEGSHQIFKKLFPNDYGAVKNRTAEIHYYKVSTEKCGYIKDWEEWQGEYARFCHSASEGVDYAGNVPVRAWRENRVPE